MRTRLTVLVAALILPLQVYAGGMGDVAGDWTLTDSNQVDIHFYQDSSESVSVILFWATWCPYCRSLMPHLQDVADEYKNSPVRFYALNVWEDGDPVRYMQENGFTFKLLMTADLVAEDYGVKGTPGLLVVDKHHRVSYRRKSGESDIDVKTALRDAIRRALDTAD